MTTDEIPEKLVIRDSGTGRFLPGSRANPNGRPTKRSLREALRDITDADQYAKYLLRRAKKSDQVAMFIFNQLEGMPKQTTEMEHKGEVFVREYGGFDPKEIE